MPRKRKSEEMTEQDSREYQEFMKLCKQWEAECRKNRTEDTIEATAQWMKKKVSEPEIEPHAFTQAVRAIISAFKGLESTGMSRYDKVFEYMRKWFDLFREDFPLDNDDIKVTHYDAEIITIKWIKTLLEDDNSKIDLICVLSAISILVNATSLFNDLTRNIRGFFRDQ